MTETATATKKSGRTPEQQAARDARKAEKAAAAAATAQAAESSTSAATAEAAPKKRKRREEGEAVTQEDDGTLLEIDTELPTPLSKKEGRKAKRSGKAPAAEDADGVVAVEGEGEIVKKDKKPKTTAEPKRKNSVWIGNLSFRTNQDNLRSFFEDGVKELGGKAEEGSSTVSRVNLPTKPGRGSFAENKGFAYVDLSTPELQNLALKLSERPLDGRRVLIKRGDDHAPSESTRTPKPLSIVAGTIPKKQPHGESSTLFVGNLPFDATEEELRDLVESSAAATVGKSFTAAQLLKERKEREEGGAAKEEGSGQESSDDEDDSENDDEEEEGDEEEEDDDDEDMEDKEKVETPKIADNSVQGRRGGEKSGLKKVRLGQFEDTGRCKGFAFLDFQTPQLATFSLANRRNHFMRGRKLVLQYASQEAAKRAGGAGGGASRPEKRQRPSYADKRESGGGDSKPRQAFRPEAPPHSRDGAGADYSRPRDGASERKPDVRGKTWEATGRPRPGAALAMAKREKVGIVEGAAPAKKITFD